MVNLALAWAERYQAEHPEVSMSVTGGGSGTGIAALINGTVDIANASRADEGRGNAAGGSQRHHTGGIHGRPGCHCRDCQPGKPGAAD